MNFLAITGLTNLLTSICVGFLILSNSLSSKKNLTFFLLNLSVLVYSLGYFLWQMAQNNQESIFYFKILFCGIVSINVMYLFFVFAVLGLLNEKIRFLIVNAIIGIVYCFLNFSGFLYRGFEIKYSFGLWPIPTFLFTIYLFIWFFQCFYGFFWLLQGLKTLKGIEYNQVKYFLIAAVVGFGGGATNWPLWYHINFPPYLNLLVSLYLVIVAYAIVRYHLMDIKVAATRVGIFAFVYTLVLGVPFVLFYKYQLPNQAIWLMLILATSGPYIYTYLRRQAEKRLLEKQLAYQNTLKQASYGIGRIKKLDTLIRLMDRILLRSVGIERCAIYLVDQLEEDPIYNLKNKSDSLPPRITITPEILDTLKRRGEPFIIEELAYHNHDDLDIKQILDFLKTFKSEIVIPIVQSDKLLSLVLLGKKKDHTIYTNDDLTVFTILASQAGLAIENCLFMEAETERLKQEGVRARRESLDMMVSTMAHEIDNPIQGAIGKADMIGIELHFFRSLLPQEKMDEIKQHAQDLMFNCQRVSKIVRAVQYYSKRETGKYKKVYIDEVIIPTRSLVSLQQKKYDDTKYSEEVEDNLPPFWGEDIMFEEIVMNLVGNAFMAVKYNEGEKRVHLHIFEKDNDYIRIEVTDNGYGIAPKIKKQLFEVPTTTKGSSEGTGIGLYRVRQICELLKATYGAESEGRGKGSMFYVEIPIYKEELHKKEENNG